MDVHLQVTKLFQPLIVTGFVLEFGQTRGAARHLMGQCGVAASGSNFRQQIRTQRLQSRGLRREQTQQRADVVRQFQSHDLLFAVHLQNGRVVKHHRTVARAAFADRLRNLLLGTWQPKIQLNEHKVATRQWVCILSCSRHVTGRRGGNYLHNKMKRQTSNIFHGNAATYSCLCHSGRRWNDRIRQRFPLVSGAVAWKTFRSVSHPPSWCCETNSNSNFRSGWTSTEDRAIDAAPPVPANERNKREKVAKSNVTHGRADNAANGKVSAPEITSV